MGRQIHIYATYPDELLLLEALRNACGIGMSYVTGDNLATMVLQSLHPVGDEAADARYDRQLAISCPQISPKIVYLNYEDGFYRIDTANSEVIEFDRCWYLDEAYVGGRFWYDPETSKTRKKRKVFLDWAEAVFRVIRRRFHPVSTPIKSYFGPNALREYQEGSLLLSPL